jgi:hypothetical protein
MNNINREEIIQFVLHHAITSDGKLTIPVTLVTTLKEITEKYGEQQKRVDDVDHWFRKLKQKDFDGTKADIEWLNNWLSELPSEVP